MAKAFPKSTFIGYDFHPASIDQARIHAVQNGVAANTRFEVGLASDFQPGISTSSRSSTACMTWATPSAQRAIPVNRSSRTAA